MSRKFAVAVQLSMGTMVIAAVVSADAAEAQRGRGGGAGMSRGSAGGGMSRSPQVRSSSRANVSTRPAGGGNYNRGNINTGNINRGNINTGNRNTNINTGNTVNRNVNVNADGYHGYAGYGDYRYRPYAPVARAAVAGAVVGATAAAVAGTYYPVLPATGCVNVYRATVSYYQCGSTWYQPTYVGTSIQYVVVTTP
jgi:hypothetical protein